MVDYTAIPEQEIERLGSVLLYAHTRDFTTDELIKLYYELGGFESFTRNKLSDGWKRLRGALVGDYAFPEDKFKELILALPKLTREDRYSFCNHPAVFKDEGLFLMFWNLNRADTFNGLCRLETHLRVEHPDFGKSWERLPQIHTEDCLNGEGRNHYWCKTPRVFHGDIAREFSEKFQSEFMALLHPTVIRVVQEEALSFSVSGRAEYADSPLVHKDHWIPLMEDKREVLNSLAQNDVLPEEIAFIIIGRHKTPMLRMDIARKTDSKPLLDAIWNSTKSKDIHREVSENTVSERPLILED